MFERKCITIYYFHLCQGTLLCFQNSAVFRWVFSQLAAEKPQQSVQLCSEYFILNYLAIICSHIDEE